MAFTSSPVVPTPVPEGAVAPVQCGGIPFPGLMLYGVYHTTGCWEAQRHGRAVDFSGGTAEHDQRQGIILEVRDVAGQPDYQIRNTPTKEGATTIYSGSADNLCFYTADRPSILHMFHIDETTFGSSVEARRACPPPPTGGAPTP